MPHILIIDAPYYSHISKALREGAEEVLKKAGATWEYQAVPGVLEIPAALSMVVNSMIVQDMMDMDEDLPNLDLGSGNYDGFITLGCVIRGETTHYEIVAMESARALMDLSTEFQLALGNGIQTVENVAQALARADKTQLNKGGHAATAALEMVKLREKFLV